jgi:hypothetical protein
MSQLLPPSSSGHSVFRNIAIGRNSALDGTFAIVGYAATIVREIESVGEFIGQAPVQERSGCLSLTFFHKAHSPRFSR